jgi:hypothetical protein
MNDCLYGLLAWEMSGLFQVTRVKQFTGTSGTPDIRCDSRTGSRFKA